MTYDREKFLRDVETLAKEALMSSADALMGKLQTLNSLPSKEKREIGRVIIAAFGPMLLQANKWIHDYNDDEDRKSTHGFNEEAP